MSETFVDVHSRGVELGRRLHLSEIGPTGAYLEHPVPMPVGSELRVTTDTGVELGVVVVRVCEQVSGAERSPGMFVRVVEMGGEGETWWREHRNTEDDPVFPEAPRTLPIAQRPTLRLERSEIEAVTHEGLQRPPRGLNARESEVPEEPEHGDPDGSNGAGSTLQGISAVAALAAAEADGKVIRDVATTMKMTPEQLKAITDNAPPEDGSNGESDKSKSKRKRRRKKKKS